VKTRELLDEPQDIRFLGGSLTAAAKTDEQKAKPLERYWTKGKGLARWAESPTPYRTLVAELRKEIPADEMTDDQLHGLAANYYHAVKGEWPGKKNSDNGNRLALLTERMNALKTTKEN
jgi:hypothetical protein